MIRRFWGVFWLDCATKETLESSYLLSAQQCDQNLNNFDEAFNWFARVKRTWLLIMDNADDQEITYSRYFPRGERGNLILTTRNPYFDEYATVGSETLVQLNPPDVLILLFKAAGVGQDAEPGNREKAEKIIELLGSHTLAVSHAGALIRRGLCSFEEFPVLFGEQRPWLLSQCPRLTKSTYGTVYKTFEVSAQRLQNSGLKEAADALEVLSILAYMHFDMVPGSMFESVFSRAESIRKDSESTTDASLCDPSVHSLELVPCCLYDSQSQLESNIAIRTACALLASLSLITIVRREEETFIRMHPLAHAWASDRLDPAQQKTASMATGAVMALSSPINNWSAKADQKLLSHAVALLTRGPCFVDDQPGRQLDYVRYHLGRLLFRNHDFRRAYHVLRRVLKSLTLRGGTLSKDVLELQTWIAFCELDAGGHQKAIETLKQVAQSRETILDATHPDRLWSEEMLAQAYTANGQPEKAIELLENVVEIRKTTLYATHPDRLGSDGALAQAYAANGRPEKAIELLENVVEIQKTTLDATHPARLWSEHALAAAYRGNKQRAKAADLIRRLDKIKQTTSVAENVD